MAEEKFQVTSEEVDKISKALKDDEFRKLFFDYAKEISDPENKQKYEEELIELEKMRGVDMKFLKPTPGYVLKLYILPEGEQKLFVNMCMSDAVDPSVAERIRGSNGKIGESWNIPYSLTPPRDDHDKEKNKCTVVDAIFHPDTYNRAQQSARFKQLLVDTALEGIEENFKIKVDQKRMKNLKMSYKGIASSSVLRVPKEEVKNRPQTVDLGGLPLNVPYPPLKDVANKAKPPSKEKKLKPPSEPRYTIVYSGEFTIQDFTNDRESSRVKRPERMLVTVELPRVGSASAVDLDIFEKRLTLECASPPYKLDLALSYPVDSDKGTAKFDKAKQALTVTLHVLPPPPVEGPSIPQRQLVNELEPTETDQNGQEESHVNPKIQNQNGLHSDANSTDADEHTHENGQESSAPSVLEDLVSTGEWSCPPFSYRQDECSVTFVLHTPNVKENSFVANFDQRFAHLTYRGASGKSYSFYVCFSEKCLLESDDCVVDVSDDNVVVLLTKDGRGLWDKFEAGLNISQTKEKLFLTESNVESAIEEMESFPDPWANKSGLSESAQVKIVSQSDSHLNIEIVDQKTQAISIEATFPAKHSKETTQASNSEDNPDTKGAKNSEIQDPPQTEVIPTELSSVTKESLEGDTQESNEHKTEITLAKSSILNDCTNSTDAPETAATVSTETATAGPMNGGSFVKMEADGSMFVRADSDYVESREKGRMEFGKETTKPPGMQFSNKLMFSLD